MNGRKPTPVQQVWGWKVAAYLFGAGMGAGAYVMGCAVLLFGIAPASIGLFAMVLGLALVGLSVPFLIWDLERPSMFLRVLIRVRRSWISRGAWILISFSTLGVLTLVLGLWPGSLLQASNGLWKVLLSLGMAMGILVGAYTGLLIGTMLARPLWNTPAIPALFLVSAISTGVAAIVLVGHLVGGAGLDVGFGDGVAAFSAWVRPIHVGLLLSELLLLYFHLNVTFGRVRKGVMSLLTGSLSRLFWGLVVTVGLVLPLILEAAGVGGRVEAVMHAAVLVGGFTLRRILLAAGTRAEIDNLGVPFAIRPEW